MRRFWVYLLCMVLCLGILGCGTEGKTEENQEDTGMVAESDKSEPEPVQETNEQSAVEAEDNTVSGESVEDVTSQPETESDVTKEIPFTEDFYEYDSMADMLAEYGIRFGTVMNADTAQDYTLQGLVGQHFNSITAANEMKAYCLLDAKASRESKNGMPVMNFSGSSGIIEAAMNNGAQVRGHVLVWDYSMSDWFFREGYQNGGDYVDRETMKKRLESYITQVITYYEETYPGVVYCWDVVNEAVGDGSSDYQADDPRRVRMTRSGKENPFYTVIGDDYVELSFLYAKNAVEALQKKNPDVDIKLFYNDYSTFYTDRREAICSLVESINSYAKDADGNPRKLCDGVGMQGYIGGYGTQNGCINIDYIKRITDAIKRFAELGVEVHITEMSVRNYSESLGDIAKHKLFYPLLMKALVEVNSGEEKPLTCIAIWGLTDMGYIDEDSYGYKMNGPYSGLFTPGYYVKDVFYEVYVMLKEMQLQK